MYDYNARPWTCLANYLVRSLSIFLVDTSETYFFPRFEAKDQIIWLINDQRTSAIFNPRNLDKLARHFNVFVLIFLTLFNIAIFIFLCYGEDLNDIAFLYN